MATRVLFLTTVTPDTDKFRESLRFVGAEVWTTRFDGDPETRLLRHDDILVGAKAWAPDYILYMGGLQPVQGGFDLGALFALNRIAPLIHIVCDAAEPNWWPALKYFDDAQCFAASVSVDGSIGTPFEKIRRGISLLTPVPPDFYRPLPWGDRPIPFGFAGSAGHSNGRAATIRDLLATGRFEVMPGAPASRSYRSMCEWMSCVRVALNHAASGSAAGQQCKGRVVEAGFAESILLESKGSTAAHWLGADTFLEYETADEAFEKFLWVNNNDGAARAIRDRFVAAVHERYHPKIFWQTLFDFARVP